MTWRRFAVLLSGLSAESRWMSSFRGDKGAERVLDGEAGVNYFRTVAARN